jgi:endonuclease G, mitochondrial
MSEYLFLTLYKIYFKGLKNIAMKKLIFVILSFLTIFTFSFAQQEAVTKDGKKVLLNKDGTWVYKENINPHNNKSYKIKKLEIPKIKNTDKVISHTGYSLLFNDSFKVANWVAYELTIEETKKEFERSNKYIPDPKLSINTNFDKDYAGSGYDKGHLASAADMSWSEIAMEESFYYSNMTPQLPGFNRGIWKKLEELVREWAVEDSLIYIVSGPVLKNGLSTIGDDKISVPKFFYKVILDYREPNTKGIGFIIPNASSDEPLQNFAVTIDSVEKLTGLDFFPLLPDNQEKEIESKLCIKCWTWKSSNTRNIKANE